MTRYLARSRLFDGLVALALLCTVGPFSSWAQEPKPRIAVLDLQGVGLSDQEVSALSDRLREALLKTDRFVLVDRSQLESLLNEQALQQAVCSGEDCATRVGELAGAKRIVGGKAVKLADGVWLVTALMVDVTTSETLDLESVRHQGSLAGLLDERMPELARRLAGLRVEPPERSHIKQERDANAPLKLAIFPSFLAGKYAARLRGSQGRYVMQLETAVKQSGGVRIEASYYQSKAFPEAQRRFRAEPESRKLKDQAWEGLFITTPNEHLVYEVGRKLGVDLVFMQRSYHNPQSLGGKSYRAYLFDVNALEVYHEAGVWPPEKWARTLREALTRLLKQYRANH